MSFPQTFAEAKASFKPMKRGRIQRTAPIRKKAKRKKRLTDGQLKKRVWKEFSSFIRTREADPEGFTTCVTCGERKHWKEMQAGHFIRGRLNANLFDERGCNAQCYACNVGRQGNVVEYYEWMLANHGPEVIAELKQQNNQTRKWRPGELQELLDRYRALNAENPLLKAVEVSRERSRDGGTCNSVVFAWSRIGRCCKDGG